MKESKEADKAMIALIDYAPVFPSLVTTPTEFGWFQISNKSLRDLAEFKLNQYPVYVKSVTAVLENIVK